MKTMMMMMPPFTADDVSVDVKVKSTEKENQAKEKREGKEEERRSEEERERRERRREGRVDVMSSRGRSKLLPFSDLLTEGEA